jgi:hypothetical protein
MPFGRGQVDEAALAEEVDSDAARERIFVDENNLGPGDGPRLGKADLTPVLVQIHR